MLNFLKKMGLHHPSPHLANATSTVAFKLGHFHAFHPFSCLLLHGPGWRGQDLGCGCSERRRKRKAHPVHPSGTGLQVSTLPRHPLSPGWPCHQLECHIPQGLLPSSEKKFLVLYSWSMPGPGLSPKSHPGPPPPQPGLHPSLVSPPLPPRRGQGDTQGDIEDSLVWRNNAEHPPVLWPTRHPSSLALQGGILGAKQPHLHQRWPKGRTRRCHPSPSPHEDRAVPT